eukprot:927753-Amphidinium_carterae.1
MKHLMRYLRGSTKTVLVHMSEGTERGINAASLRLKQTQIGRDATQLARAQVAEYLVEWSSDFIIRQDSKHSRNKFSRKRILRCMCSCIRSNLR